MILKPWTHFLFNLKRLITFCLAAIYGVNLFHIFTGTEGRVVLFLHFIKGRVCSVWLTVLKRKENPHSIHSLFCFNSKAIPQIATGYKTPINLKVRSLNIVVRCCITSGSMLIAIYITACVYQFFFHNLLCSFSPKMNGKQGKQEREDFIVLILQQ